MPDTVETKLARIEERQIAIGRDVCDLRTVIERLCELRERNTEKIVRLEENQGLVIKIVVALQLVATAVAAYLAQRGV